jgi:UDP-N-acetylmuramyl tripeptide synthase
MLNFLKTTAILAGKILIALSRMVGNQGSNFPGRFALKIYPSLLKELGENTNKDVFIITGTNGKTTTTNMIARIFKENGSSFVHNQAGANMIAGITTAFIQQTDIKGLKRFDYALLETDEANVPLLIDQIKPRLILITNFFRDQLDRYGELDTTIKVINEAVQGTNIEMLLNADDPLQVVFQNRKGVKYWYYGFDSSSYDSLIGSESREGRFCVLCGHELEYTRYHYAQLGKYNCPQCNNQNPRADFTAAELYMDPSIHMLIDNLSIHSPYQGFFNAYNILAAVSLGKLAGIPEDVIQRAIANFEPNAGRMETFYIRGKKVILVLVKNPTGLNQSLSMLLQDTAEKNLFIALNDNAADGRDISWIWDADVEIIMDEKANIKRVICSGKRSGDMAVRIKYAGFDAENIIIKSSLEEGIEAATRLDSEVSYILCTYTTLFASRNILARKQKKFPLPESGNAKKSQKESGV